MRFLEATEDHISVECSKCKNTAVISRKDVDELGASGFKFKQPRTCTCGMETAYIMREGRRVINDEMVRCPKCLSDQITTSNKGFGLGKAALGGVLLGPVGLLGGLVGSNKVLITCLRCGNQWSPGS